MNETEALSLTEQQADWIIKTASNKLEMFEATVVKLKSIRDKFVDKSFDLNAEETGALFIMVQETITEVRARQEAYEVLSKTDKTKYIGYKARIILTMEMLQDLRQKLLPKKATKTQEQGEVQNVVPNP